LPLKTPYPAVVARIGYIMNHLPRGTSLVVDYTGVGKGIFDMIVDAGLDAIGVTITSGFTVNWSGTTVTVPKSTLVSTLVARLHGGELFVHESLKDWPVLRRELLNFRPEVTRAGSETWNARSGEHDDLVLALGLAVWQLTAGQPFQGLVQFYRQLATAGGVDLGQSVDPTAICVVSRIDRPGPTDLGDSAFTQENVMEQHIG
jgi:hypothetical protein